MPFLFLSIFEAFSGALTQLHNFHYHILHEACMSTFLPDMDN